MLSANWQKLNERRAYNGCKKCRPMFSVCLRLCLCVWERQRESDGEGEGDERVKVGRGDSNRWVCQYINIYREARGAIGTMLGPDPSQTSPIRCQQASLSPANYALFYLFYVVWACPTLNADAAYVLYPLFWYFTLKGDMIEMRRFRGSTPF